MKNWHMYVCEISNSTRKCWFIVNKTSQINSCKLLDRFKNKTQNCRTQFKNEINTFLTSGKRLTCHRDKL